MTLPNSAGNVEVRTLESGADRMVFVFNHEKSATDASVELRIPAGNYEAADLMEEHVIPALRKGEFLELKKRIDGGEVWVVRVHPHPAPRP